MNKELEGLLDFIMKICATQINKKNFGEVAERLIRHANERIKKIKNDGNAQIKSDCDIFMQDLDFLFDILLVDESVINEVVSAKNRFNKLKEIFTMRKKERDKNKYPDIDLAELYIQIYNRFKRTYDMSRLYIPGLTPIFKGCIPVYNGIENQFKGKDGSIITIKIIGRLKYGYSEANGKIIDDEYIEQYEIKIKRPNEVENTPPIEVFTEISTHRMTEDEEYRRCVLEELLSTNNIDSSYSKECKYIGEISDAKNEANCPPVGEESFSNSRYIYRFSENYVLVYDAEHLNAVKHYEDVIKRNRREDGPEI